MANAFKHFIDQIPPETISGVSTFATKDMVVFNPRFYVIGTNMYLEDYHFVLPTSAPPPLRVELHEHQFQKGRLLAFSPETRLFCSKPVPTGQYTALSIKKDFFQEIAKDAFGKTGVSFGSLNNPYSAKLLNLIGSFKEELACFQESSSLALQSISTQVVIQILRETQNKVKAARFHADKNYISRAREYMLAYYSANIKIEDICKEVHLSPYYFVRMFKEKTGQSPHEFLMSVRMTKAVEMLKNGDYSIEEIARFCGFVNSGHFSTYFKKKLGMPPSLYKKRYFSPE